MVIALDLKGLAVSTGAACSSGAIEPSHVLIAMGLRPDQARSSIRFSLGKQTTAEDIDLALALVPETVARLARTESDLQEAPDEHVNVEEVRTDLAAMDGNEVWHCAWKSGP